MRVEIELNTDPRRWSAGARTQVALSEVLPATTPAGDYTLAMWLPDRSSSLRNRSVYATRFANEGTWDSVAGYNVLGSMTVLPATTCANGVGSRFADIGADNAFCADIEWLANAAITKGCNPPANDLFCPDVPVSRGQMAAFLHRALERTLVAGPAPVFADSANSLFADSINWLGATGVTRGCNPPVNDQFCPTALVTGGQMAAFLVRALNLAGGTTDVFTDDDGSVFETDIELLASAEITRGCNPPLNDRFCPTSPVTREQMAAFLHRALGP